MLPVLLLETKVFQRIRWGTFLFLFEDDGILVFVEIIDEVIFVFVVGDVDFILFAFEAGEFESVFCAPIFFVADYCDGVIADAVVANPVRNVWLAD